MSAAVLDRGGRAVEPAAPGAGRARRGGGPWRDGRGPMRRDGAGSTVPTVAGHAGRAAVGGQASLEDVISGAWEGLVAHRSAACPVCGGHMAPRYGASGLAPVGGRCTDCGSVLG